MRARLTALVAVLALSGVLPATADQAAVPAPATLTAKLGPERTACLLARLGIEDRLPAALRSQAGCNSTATRTTDHEPLPQCVKAAGVNDVCEKWGMRFTDTSPYTSFQRDDPVGIVPSPRGDKLYVAGTSNVDTGAKMTVAALSPSDGRTLWIAHPLTTLPTAATAMAVSPDGSRVYVTGIIVLRPDLQSLPYSYFLTVAFSTSSGKQLWMSRYDGIGGWTNIPTAMQVSPRGDRVYVTGFSDRPGPWFVIPQDWATVAMSASTGKGAWSGRYSGLAGGNNRAFDIALSPTGDRVYMTGYSERPTMSPTQKFDMATAAFRASNGRGLWVTRYASVDIAAAVGLAVGRDDTVYVAGYGQYAGTGAVYDYVTIAYRGSDRRARWVARFRGTPGGSNVPRAVVVAPKGDRVFVTGQSDQKFSTVPGTVPDVYLPTYGTVAYTTSNGKQAWVARYSPQNVPSLATAMTVDPSGRRLFVAGAYGSANGLFNVTNIATVAYDTAKGTSFWTARYDLREPDSAGNNFPVGITTNPKGNVVYQVSSIAPAGEAASGTACGAVSRCRGDAGDLLVLSYDA